MFEILGGCNVHITFKNDVTVSIFIGGGSYSDNHDADIGNERGKNISSSTVELAAWGVGGKWITRELRPDATDNVLGYQTIEQLLGFLNKAANRKEEEG